jgi:hypothetical protein
MSNTLRAILIDAKNKTVSEIQIGKDYKEISKAIHVDLFTAPKIFPNGDTLYVDDEGLINGTPDFFFNSELYPHPLAGSGLILGSDDEGESQDAKTKISDLGEFYFMDRMGVALFHYFNK